MGVKGLWRLLSSCGTPVPLESLENRILAVDISIWLHQAVKGFRGDNSVANAHLLTLFHRICKLLFYRIRPVFIFDGGVPHLKRQTISSRRLKRDVAAGKAQKVRERLLTNLLKSQVVRNALGRKGPGPVVHHVPKIVKKDNDLFELPPMPVDLPLIKCEIDSSSGQEKSFLLNDSNAPSLHNFDFENTEFKSLSLEQQHEVLIDIQGTRKDNSWSTVNEMPPELNSFSTFQMDRLLRRKKFQETIDNVRSDLQQVHTKELEFQLFGDLEKYVGQSQIHKIVSEDSSHSLLLKRKHDSSTQQYTNRPTELQKQISEVEKAASQSKDDRLVGGPKQDFLTELAKQGIVSISKDTFYESDFSLDCEENSSDEETEMPIRKKRKLEEVSFLKAMDYVLDNSELTQEEILSLIKSSNNEIENDFARSDIHSHLDLNKPSTSANAPGQIFQPVNFDNEGSSSSDDDDFIDVTPTPSDNEEINDTTITSPNSKSNVNVILGSKCDSLYLKIVQQKLDDVVHLSSVKKSFVADSRKTGNNGISTMKLKTGQFSDLDKSDTVNSPKKSESKGVIISLNLEKKKLTESEDIFADIFRKREDIVIPTKFIAVSKQNVLNVDSISDISTKENDSTFENVHLTDDLETKFSQLVEEEVQKIISLATSECQKKMVSKNLSKDITFNVKQNNLLSDDSNYEESNAIDLRCDDSLIITSSDESLEHDTEQSSPTHDTEQSSPTHDTEQSSQTHDTKQSSPTHDTEQSTGLKEVNLSKLKDKTINISTMTPKEVNNSPINFQRDTGNDTECKDKYNNTVDKPIEKPLMYSDVDLNILENELEIEQNILTSKVQSINRVASEMADHIYSDAQELLQLFGLPYLVAPMEAEAQCGFLDSIGLTHGTITDDSDIFLFGGKKVYKQFFNQTKHVELFKSENIFHHFGLSREKLIILALLTGSDYTVGIESVGSVLGMEILSEFKGENIECLKNFKKWWTVANKTGVTINQSKTKQRLVKVYLPESFPNENIIDAYMKPEVDESKEKFSWSMPSIDKLEHYLGSKFGWSKAKSLEILIPVFKKMGISESQMRIDSYFTNIKLVKEGQQKSKRLQDAIERSRDVVGLESSSIDNTGLSKNLNDKTTQSLRNKIILTDPMNCTYGPGMAPPNLTIKKKRGRKRKSIPVTDCSNNSSTIAMDTSADLIVQETDQSPIRSKDEQKKVIYEKLLGKDKIMQREADRKEMENKKLLAVTILKAKSSLKNRRVNKK